MKAIHLVMLVCFFVLTLTVYHQGVTITAQRKALVELRGNCGAGR